MRIPISVENPGHTCVEVDDKDILAAYESGGIKAVNMLVQAHADSLESPFWFTEDLTEDDIKELK